MSVVILPLRHPGTRQPPTFVVRLPNLSNNPKPTILVGVDGDTQTAVLAELARFEVAIAEAEACTDRIATLLQPFMAEGVE